jgi:hypothetical protein
MREGAPSPPYLITDSEFIVTELNAKNLNQKWRKRYTLATIDVLDRQTTYKIGDVIRNTCPGVKISAARQPIININTNGTKRQ